MATLDSISATDPGDGEAVSQGASRIRALVDAVKNTVDVEHTLTGLHMLPHGNSAARPAAGSDGRVYLNSETRQIELDSGSAWGYLPVVPYFYAYTAGTVSTGTSSSYAPMQTVLVTVPTNGVLFALGWADYAPGVNPLLISTVISVDSTPITGSGVIITIENEQGIITPGFSTSVTAGSHTLGLLATSTTSAAAVCSLRNLLVFVL